MSNKKGFSPLLGVLVLTALCIGAIIPSSLAWYSVTTSISVSSSSVMVSTANPNYGVFELDHLYILQPDLGEIDLESPPLVPPEVNLFPVSSLNGQHYYFKYGDNKIAQYDEGVFRLLIEASYSEMPDPIRLHFYFDVGVPTVGGVSHPNWTRVHMQICRQFDWTTRAPVTDTWYTALGYILLRDEGEHPQAMNPSHGRNADYDTGNVTRKPLDTPFYIDLRSTVTPRPQGKLFFIITLYLEGTLCNQQLDGTLPFSLTIIPSRQS